MGALKLFIPASNDETRKKYKTPPRVAQTRNAPKFQLPEIFSSKEQKKAKFHLKDGKVLSGIIMMEEASKIYLDTAEGMIAVLKSEIQDVEEA